MEYIKKEDITSRLQKLIDVRKKKQCSKGAIVEAQAFQYALAIVNQAEVFNFEENNNV